MSSKFRGDRSPYLHSPTRLADVVAAIQAMSVYKWYKLTFEDWADRISGDKGGAAHWKNVFEEHPEFFRLDAKRERASLVWRRQYPKLYHVDQRRELSREEHLNLPADQYQRISRVPLRPDDTEILIRTAIDLHTRALEGVREQRWWLPVATGIGGLVLGLIGMFLQK